ncbi:PREDICTED: major vault protein-like [Amphimedon queenslandica]|uniref:Major vault protein n=1 Tax=Amphimedon queenslandica TaxID=400682 RepID=A0AAN0J061_AMPQE|nr:PREDICTED: major vault protein-like [Amphimedon queenslandica]|eukprot:XP_019850101.1 PREDICTED: major vault protein-like [Amphimedon queenslandica]
MDKLGKKDAEAKSIYRIPPYYYLHVLDQNTNVTKVEVGPQTFIRQDNEKVILGPEKMIVVPPRHYCVIENPVVRDGDSKPILDSNGQVKLRHADQEIRLAQDPFPLFPGENLKQSVQQLKVVPANSALRLRAILDFEDQDGTKRVAGDEWLFEGPGTFIPCKEVAVEETIRATVIRPNQAIKLRARKETTDRDGNDRVTGEEWLVKKVGAYLPGAYEEVVDVVDAYVLTEKVALHMRATRTFNDKTGTTRKNGEEWLIKMEDTEAHIPDVYEEVVGIVNITTLNNRQYCVILDPVGDDGKPQLGQKKLIKGERSFFLRPGERFEKGTQNVFVLGEDEGLILKANEAYTDDDHGVDRRPGDRWMIRGPLEYVPPVEVEVVTKRVAIPLDENEGIYVRDIKTGRVRAICGATYMLTQDEELWAKELPPGVEELLSEGKDPLADRSDRGRPSAQLKRDKNKVVTFRVPHNAAVQIYDYKDKKARVVFGPEMVMLGPDEQFTQLSLSGGKPKRPNQIRSLCLLLGPDFCTDIITVETADHARLSLQLSYNWHFDVDKTSADDASKIFSVPDFVGDACKAIASRVRGTVAGVQFDDFHKLRQPLNFDFYDVPLYSFEIGPNSSESVAVTANGKLMITMRDMITPMNDDVRQQYAVFKDEAVTPDLPVYTSQYGVNITILGFSSVTVSLGSFRMIVKETPNILEVSLKGSIISDCLDAYIVPLSVHCLKLRGLDVSCFSTSSRNSIKFDAEHFWNLLSRMKYLEYLFVNCCSLSPLISNSQCGERPSRVLTDRELVVKESVIDHIKRMTRLKGLHVTNSRGTTMTEELHYFISQHLLSIISNLESLLCLGIDISYRQTTKLKSYIIEGLESILHKCHRLAVLYIYCTPLFFKKAIKLPVDPALYGNLTHLILDCSFTPMTSALGNALAISSKKYQLKHLFLASKTEEDVLKEMKAGNFIQFYQFKGLLCRHDSSVQQTYFDISELDLNIDFARLH